jgi:DnaK suppressor protein
MNRNQTLAKLKGVLTDKLNRITNVTNPESRLTDPHAFHELSMAFKQIGQGKYGICIECGSNIPLARLTIKPEAVRCINCQKKFERMVTN